jgi:hypothetical protein
MSYAKVDSSHLNPVAKRLNTWSPFLDISSVCITYQPPLIEVAFNNTSYDSMCAALAGHGVDYTIVRWIRATL